MQRGGEGGPLEIIIMCWAVMRFSLNGDRIISAQLLRPAAFDPLPQEKKRKEKNDLRPEN